MSEVQRAALWARFPEPVKKFTALYMSSMNLCVAGNGTRNIDPDLAIFRQDGLEIIYRGEVNQEVTELRFGIKLSTGKLNLQVTMKYLDREEVQKTNLQTLSDVDFPKEAKRWAEQLAPFLWTGEF